MADATIQQIVAPTAISNVYNVHTSWTIPSPADNYLHSTLYRKLLSGAGSDWVQLNEDGNWSATKTAYQFGLVESGHVDTYNFGVSGGACYQYRATHIYSVGDPVVGPAATFYIDTPIISQMAINDGVSVVESRGIFIQISADSGDDTGNVADAVEWVRFKESGGTYGEYRKYVSGADYPFTLSASNGTKTVVAQVYSSCYQPSAEETVTVSLTEGSSDSTADQVENETWVLAGPFCSDASTADMEIVKLDGTESDICLTAFPASNMSDCRLSVKAVATNEVTESVSMIIRCDLNSTAKTPCFAMIGGHNLDAYADYCDITLRTYYTGGGTVGVEAKINNLTGQDPIFVDLRDTSHAGISARYVEIHIVQTTTPLKVPTRLEVGRMIVVGSADYIQPVHNFRDNWPLIIRRAGEVVETSDTNYVTNEYHFVELDLDMSNYSTADAMAIMARYVANGAANPVLALLSPVRLPIVRAVSTAVDTYPYSHMAYYCAMSGDSLDSNSQQALTSLSLKLRQLVEVD